MEGQKDSVKLKSYYLAMIILLPLIVVSILLYLSNQEGGFRYLYMLLLILFGSFMGYIKLYNFPREIKVFENFVEIRTAFGRELIIEIKDILRIKEKFGIIIIITKKEKIMGINGFPNISLVIEDINNQIRI